MAYYSPSSRYWKDSKGTGSKPHDLYQLCMSHNTISKVPK